MPELNSEKPSVHEMLSKAGLRESVPVRGCAELNFKSEAPPLSSSSDMRTNFPDLHIKVIGVRSTPGQPFTMDYEVFGPIEQVRRFAERFGSEDLKDLVNR